MGIYEDSQIHTKTSFRPIKLQENWSGPHTNRKPSIKLTYQLIIKVVIGTEVIPCFHIGHFLNIWKHLDTLRVTKGGDVGGGGGRDVKGDEGE